MDRWLNRLILVAVVWLGAFGAAALAVVLLREENDVEGLRYDVARLSAKIDQFAGDFATPTPSSEATPTASVSPSPTVGQPRILAVGSVSEWEGFRITVDSIEQSSTQPSVTNLYFTLENTDGNPYTSGYLRDVQVVDTERFTCRAYTAEHRGTFLQGLPVGQKAQALLAWDCLGGQPATATFAGSLTFEFPMNGGDGS
jgi:hypothetical protein